jgi:excisionase family DNA binding protein
MPSAAEANVLWHACWAREGNVRKAAYPPWLEDIYQGLAPLLTVLECAEVLRVSPETVRRHCRAGSLRAVQQHTGRGGSPILIPRTSVIEWLRLRTLHPRGETESDD